MKGRLLARPESEGGVWLDGVKATPGLFFDEQFESWGSEDRDFAYQAFKAGLRPQLLDGPNAIHLMVAEDSWFHMTHADIVKFLRNKTYLAEKYPDGEMEPSLDLVRYCHLDDGTRRWSMGPRREATSVHDVLAEFKDWLSNPLPARIHRSWQDRGSGTAIRRLANVWRSR